MKTKKFNACVDQYADGLFRFARRILGNDQEAEDVVQRVFEKFWLKFVDVADDKWKSYLFTSVHNLSLDIIRRRKLAKEAAVETVQVYENPDAFEIKDAIQKALNKLSPVQRTVVLLRDYEGYPYIDIASMTGLSESQVKVYIFRARKKLQLSLNEYRYA